MLLLLIDSGVKAGASIIGLKLVGELFAAGEVADHLIIFFTLCIMMLLTSISQVHSLNLAMKYYEQLEVMPINMTCIMIS